MKNILICGGAGYIGTHLAVILCQNGFVPIIADNFCNSPRQAVDEVSALVGQSIAAYDVDVSNTNKLDGIFSRHKIDAIVHLAGYKSVGESLQKPILYYQNNVGCTVAVCCAATKHGVKNIIYSSSATVYAAKDTAHKETDQLKAINPYGQTKIISENILRDLANSDSSLNVTVLRYFNPLGKLKGLSGENVLSNPTNIMPLLVKAYKDKTKIKVFGNDYDTVDGSCVRDYLHIVDLCNAHLAVLDKMKGHQTYNIGTGTGVSVLQLIKAFNQANNADIEFEIDNRRAGDAAISYADVTKARSVLGFETKHSLIQMCRDAL